MAAQAVDFTISGHVNRALFVTDGDDGTKAEVKNNTGSSTRVRANGSTELMNGNTVGIQFEYEESGTGVKLRHANVQYGGAFGKVTLGQGSEAGDGSQYSDTTGVWGIGHGAGTSTAFSLGDFFGSLDSGGRVNMVRYDTPNLGPLGAAVSVANDDRVSGLLKLSSEFSGTTLGAQLGWLKWNKSGKRFDNPSTFGASVGATMASGLTVSGAWAKGDDMYVDFTDKDSTLPGKIDEDLVPFLKRFDLELSDFFGGEDPIIRNPANHSTDPSYFQAEVGYKFGNTGVAVSWYRSEDFVVKDSEGTAIGIGARHTLPKAGAELYAAAQNYDVELVKSGKSVDETVFMFGTRVKF